jgi:CRISPR/Cas system Type II protein with McrA/HNH and RuvC-like nuclease domain
MEVRQIAALIIALLTIVCLGGAFLYATRESRADRRGYKRSARLRARRSKERVTEATRLREQNRAVESA